MYTIYKIKCAHHHFIVFECGRQNATTMSIINHKVQTGETKRRNIYRKSLGVCTNKFRREMLTRENRDDKKNMTRVTFVISEMGICLYLCRL